MAEVILNPNLAETRWLTDEYLTPYIRQSGLENYMGSGSNAVIRMFTEEKTDGGKDIIIPLAGLLRGQGVTDSQVLEGNEEDLGQFADKITCRWRRNAVKVPKSSSYRSNLDILKIAGPRLREWAAKVVLKLGVVYNLQGVVVPGAVGVDGFLTPDTVVRYSTATAAQRNTFLANNTDRIMFGNATANAASGVFATALGLISGTTDKLSTTMISKARRVAQATADIASGTSAAITPYMTKNGEEWYVMFVHPRQMRDLRTDATMTQANRDAMERGKDNPLFTAGDLLWEGVIIHELRDMEVIAGAGAAGVDVAIATLMGQSAVGVAYGQEPKLISDSKQDYSFRPATAVEECIGIKKLSFEGRMYGVVEVITAAAADS